GAGDRVLEGVRVDFGQQRVDVLRKALALRRPAEGQDHSHLPVGDLGQLLRQRFHRVVLTGGYLRRGEVQLDDDRVQFEAVRHGFFDALFTGRLLCLRDGVRTRLIDRARVHTEGDDEEGQE